MRKIQLFILSLVVVLFTACHGNLWDAIEDLDARVARLEELCKEMNTNITSLQTIVSVIQENDVITGITPIEKGGKVIGYTITFDKHEPITIYNGEDGKDGANGANGIDGKDGYTPILGVAQDSDGVYYWTLDGEWLLDAEGNKLRVTGRDGKDGADGKDGQDGQDGKDGVDGEDGKDGQDGTNGTNGMDGKDGVTPQLKIEEGYWYISYDNGATWTELGKAVGEDGKDGQDGKPGKDGQDGKPGADGKDGKDGKDGDSMFTKVTYDEKNVYLTLTNGTVLIIPLGEGVWEALEGLEERIAKLEALCKEMNTNISALQTIVSALQSNDYITAVVPVEKEGKVIGYTITFGKHDPITIYNGEDGKDGVNGTNGVDGKDGYTPILGVAKDTDGVYYWTLDGEWLLDAEDNKLRVTGRDGKDGVDGEDGKDGQDGTNGTNGVDGKDGVTPQLKIENGYWYISYDKGATWTELGKAVGEDGKDGQDGKPGTDGTDGKDGDSMFTKVTYDEKNVYLTLTNGTVLTIPLGEGVWEALEGLEERIAKLEALCKEMNTNISALQTIVSALQSNDYITAVVPVEKEGKVIGYTITFGKHDPITIYNGEDGKDGVNGTNGIDGKDGYTPILGVAKDTDGVYYWTLDGEWLLDAEDNKLRVTGRDGKDGVDGEDGKDGENGKDGVDGEDGQDGTNGINGTDGKDGVTPQLKIENGYWYISYDKGATWTELGKAVGEDGKDGVDGENGKDGQDGKPGADGKDGQDGDSMFTSVTYDDNNVYFTLTDGSVLIVPRGNSTSEFDQTVIDNLVTSLILDKEEMNFSYSEIGTTKTIVATTLPFAESKVRWESSNLDVATVTNGVVLAIGVGKTVITASAGDKKAECLVVVESNSVYPERIVDLGLPSGLKWATCNVGASTPEEYGDYFAWGETQPKEKYDWSTYKYCNGSNSTLTKYCDESSYGNNGFTDTKKILDPEDDAATVNWGGTWRMPTEEEYNELKNNCTLTYVTENGVKGCRLTGLNGNSIFLPFAGDKVGLNLRYNGTYGRYWISSLNSTTSAGTMFFYSNIDEFYTNDRYYGRPIRPVCP